MINSEFSLIETIKGEVIAANFVDIKDENFVRVVAIDIRTGETVCYKLINKDCIYKIATYPDWKSFKAICDAHEEAAKIEAELKEQIAGMKIKES